MDLSQFVMEKSVELCGAGILSALNLMKLFLVVIMQVCEPLSRNLQLMFL